MKKRIIALLCALAMLAGLLAGCGSKEAPTVKTPSVSTITPGASDGTPAPAVQPAASSYTVYVQAISSWGTIRLWAWSETEGDLFESWPGKTMEMGADGWYAMSIPKEYDYVIVNGLDGNIQTQDEWTGGQDIWFTIAEDGYGVSDTKPSGTAAAPADGYIAELDGKWENVHLNDGSSSLDVAAKVFSQTVYNCTEMTISMEVEMNAGTSCKDWQVWGRSGSSFVKLDRIYLAAGNGYTSQTLTFDTPVTFDAIAITPTVPGGYSWSLGFIITDVWTES